LPSVTVAKTRSAAEGTAAPTVLTIGHSARSLDEFLALLRAHGVTQIVDVRKLPRSRANPQFNVETLPSALRAAGIGYQHLPGLGGLRRPRPDSVNTAWRHLSFRGYADYMQTPEFADNLDQLLQLAQTGRVAILCAEAVPWRCHRSLIADALVARGTRVLHVMSVRRTDAHTLRPWACVEGGRVSYPSGKEQA
jgi:uncharacterized protein (DUF488 family)